MVSKASLFLNYRILPSFILLVFQQRQENTEMTLNRSAEILVNFILAPALMILLFYFMLMWAKLS